MIQKLRRRMLLTIMIFVTVILVAFVTVVCVVPMQRDRRDAQEFLARMAENDGVRMEKQQWDKPLRDEPQQRRGEESPFTMSNLATAELDAEGSLLRWSSDRLDLYDEDYMRSAVQAVLQSDNDFGVFDGQYYLLHETESGSLLILMDNSIAFANLRRTLTVTLAMGLAAWALMLGLAILLVNKMTKPVTEAFEKQRQFISDAGHELKTPVSVIAANVNVLQTELGDNRWLGYIQSETGRMEHLIRDLMSLAEMDGTQQVSEPVRFDLSKAVLRSALPFESLAFEKGMTMEFAVTPDLFFCGDEERLCQLVVILLSNAVKYGSERGQIRIALAQEGRKLLLRVYNTGQGIAPEEQERIFDRFYRVDKARSRESGSYGLGLAIAQAIVTEHHGRIGVESTPGEWVEFTVTFNANER